MYGAQWLLPLAILVACEESLQTSDKSGDDTAASYTITYDDADGDTIIDIHEGDLDPDGDGLPNSQDEDSDGDTIEDSHEAGDSDPLTLPLDSDGDGNPDYLDLDSDNNCVRDRDEKGSPMAPVDTDLDGTADYADDDNDGDGILDVYEIGEDCAIPDSDQDGSPDYMDLDSDGDGVGDLWEGATTEWEQEPADTDGDGVYDYLDDDSDGDGILDSDEGSTDHPLDEPRDTDGDGTYDFADIDSDGDSLTDQEELETYGTDPYDGDTDGDGYSDGGEIAADTDPLDAESVIDGIYVEVPERTTAEEVFEFELSIQMGDIAFLLDTTGSMSSTAQAMASEFSTIVSALVSTIPDAEYGVATYDDYAYGSYGYASSGDKPFILLQQVTDSTSSVQSVLSSISLHYGGDGPESSMEAIYQAATGAGYDQSCDSSYDSSTDVLPFLAHSTDPYNGSGGQSYNSSSSGGGEIGGLGFRDYALPVIVYATDYDLRDPDAGYGVPGGCHLDAGHSDVVTAMSDLGGYLIGIHVSSYTTTPFNQMVALAQDTNSYADTDGDGVRDDELVFSWSGSSSAFQSTVTGAIEDLVTSIRFSSVSLEIEGDEWGFITGMDPESYDDIDPSDSGSLIDFTLTFRGVVAATTEDQLFKLTLNVIGDDTILLDSLDIIVVVPGTSY